MSVVSGNATINLVLVSIIGILIPGNSVLCNDINLISNTEYGFQIAIPESWTIEQNHNSVDALIAHSPKAAGSTKSALFMIRVIPLEQSINVKAFVENYLPFQAKKHQNYQLQEVINVSLANGDGYEVKDTYDVIPAGGDKAIRKSHAEWIRITTTKGYLLEKVTNSDDSEQYNEEINSIVSSFKIIESVVTPDRKEVTGIRSGFRGLIAVVSAFIGGFGFTCYAVFFVLSKFGIKDKWFEKTSVVTACIIGLCGGIILASLANTSSVVRWFYSGDHWL